MAVALKKPATKNTIQNGTYVKLITFLTLSQMKINFTLKLWRGQLHLQL